MCSLHFSSNFAVLAALISPRMTDIAGHFQADLQKKTPTEVCDVSSESHCHTSSNSSVLKGGSEKGFYV